MRRNILIPTLRRARYNPNEQERSDLASMLNKLGNNKTEAKRMVETLIGKDVFSFEDCVKTLLKGLRKV